MKTLIFISFFFLIFDANAAMKKLAQEYLGNNSSVLKSKAQISSSLLDISSVKAQKIWSLTYSGLKKKDNLEQVNPFFIRDTSVTTQVLSLGKSFNWGGELSLNNSLINYKAPAIGNTQSLSSHGFSQGLSYKQDLGANLLGRSFYSQVETATGAHASTEAAVLNNVQIGLFDFASNYSQAKLSLSLLKLQEEARLRAKRRKELIRKQVRDGLKEKVDLIQAKIELLASGEEVQSAQMQKKSSLEKLSNLLHRNISIKEITPFDTSALDLKNILAGDANGNLEIISLKGKLRSLRSSKKQVDYSFWPTVNAGLEYNVNDFNTTKGQAVSDGNLLGERAADETKLSLNLIWTIGNEGQKIARAKNNIELRSTEMETSKLRINFSKTKESLIAQIALLEKNLTSVKTRKLLAETALKEMTKLYNRGRADLDQVIRAEESLISTERSLVNYLAQRENLTYRIASLYGTLQEYLLR